MIKETLKNVKEVNKEREEILEKIANARLRTIQYYQEVLTKEEWLIIDILEKENQKGPRGKWIEISKDILTKNVIDALINYFNYVFKKTEDNRRFEKIKEGMTFYFIKKEYGKLF